MANSEKYLLHERLHLASFYDIWDSTRTSTNFKESKRKELRLVQGIWIWNRAGNRRAFCPTAVLTGEPDSAKIFRVVGQEGFWKAVSKRFSRSSAGKTSYCQRESIKIDQTRHFWKFDSRRFFDNWTFKKRLYWGHFQTIRRSGTQRVIVQ